MRPFVATQGYELVFLTPSLSRGKDLLFSEGDSSALHCSASDIHTGGGSSYSFISQFNMTDRPAAEFINLGLSDNFAWHVPMDADPVINF